MRKQLKPWMIALVAAVALITAALALLPHWVLSDTKWSLRAEPSAQAEEVREQLQELGAPKAVLDDMTDAQVLACAGAKRVLEYRDEVRDGVVGSHLMIELAEENRWMAIHHLSLGEGEYRTRGTDRIWWMPACYGDLWGKIWWPEEDPAARVLYSRDGVEMEAPLQVSYASGYGDWSADLEVRPGGRDVRVCLVYPLERVNVTWVNFNLYTDFYRQTGLVPGINREKLYQTAGMFTVKE